MGKSQAGTSGVHQGSILCPTLFVIFINPLDLVVDKLASILSKFTDDTKVGCEVNSEEDRLLLQEVIDHIMNWAEEWKTEFNASKCKVLHLGKKKKQLSFTM